MPEIPLSRPQARPQGGILRASSRAMARRLAHSLHPAVLALQGSVEPHVAALERLGFTAHLVRRPEQLASVTHLILPGGESTTLHHLLVTYGLWGLLRRKSDEGTLAILGTCAGAILMGKTSGQRPPRLDLMDVEVERNAYGRQVDSFVAKLDLAAPIGEVEGVFIRAPRCRRPGPSVEVLGTLRGDPVLLRQGRLLASTFHPELSSSPALHRYFLSL